MLTLLGVLIAGVVTFYVCRFLWELISVGDLKSKAVFITGCDTGFGRELAKKCAKNGLTVFAGCFTEKCAQTLREECPKIKTVPLDVSKDESVTAARDQVIKEMPAGVKLWAVVNNAGIFSCYGPDDWTTIDDYKLSIEVNVLGVIRVTHAFKKLVKESRGRIVAVSSVNGRIATPAAGPYVVAKFGCEAYMDSLRQELRLFGVKCSLLEPGVFRTPLIDPQAMLQRVEGVWAKLDDDTKEEYGEKFKNYFATMWNELFLKMSSTNLNLVVDNYYHGITARFPRARYYCGYDSMFFFVPVSMMPSWLSDRIISGVGKQEVVPARYEHMFKK